MRDHEQDLGLVGKWRVTRVSGTGTRGKHTACEFFVLDWKHDRFAVPAARAYADACERDYPELAKDLRAKADRYEREARQ